MGRIAAEVGLKMCCGSTWRKECGRTAEGRMTLVITKAKRGHLRFLAAMCKDVSCRCAYFGDRDQ